MVAVVQGKSNFLLKNHLKKILQWPIIMALLTVKMTRSDSYLEGITENKSVRQSMDFPFPDYWGKVLFTPKACMDF